MPGVVEGSTESAAVCRRLLEDLIGRGLPVERARLFVIDGAKGLRKAIKEVFGAWALVQRCSNPKVSAKPSNASSRTDIFSR